MIMSLPAAPPLQQPERCTCRGCVVCLIDARVRNEELKRRLEENRPAVDAYLARKRREARVEHLKVQASWLRVRLARLSSSAEEASERASPPLHLSGLLIAPPSPSVSLLNLRVVINALRSGALSAPSDPVSAARAAALESELVTLQRRHVAAVFKYLPLEFVSPREVLVINTRIPIGNVEQIVQIIHSLAFVLDVVLPFSMVYCGSSSTIAPRGSEASYPLYVTKDKTSLKKAVALLGMNVSALLYSQGLVIPMDAMGDIFVNLIRLQQHPSLGRAEGLVMNYDVSSLLDPTHEDDISAIDERREWAFVDS